MNASPSVSGSYIFKIVSGIDKAGLGSNNAVTVFTSANSVDLNSTSFSTAGADVSATVKVGNWTSAPFNIRIHTAWVTAQNANPVTVSDPTYGYETTYSYTIYDQFGNLLPNDLPVNEDFPSGWVDDAPFTNWPGTTGNGTMTFENTFVDRYSGASGVAIPLPTGPCQPQLCNTKVNHAFQEYRAGSLTPGHGFRMQTNTVQAYTDHGAAENIVSPAPSPAP